MRYRLYLLLVSVIAIVGLSSAVGQDTGVMDTVRYVPESTTWTIDAAGDSLFSIELFGWTDQGITAFSLGFKIPTSTGGGTGHDDSLIVVDTFNYIMSTALPVPWSFSAVDSARYPGAKHSLYNGCLLGRIMPYFPPNTSSKVGDFFIKIPDPTLLPCEFDIAVDSVFFPPAGAFKFSPSSGSGYAPQYVGATIHVVNNICSPVEDPTIGLDPASFTFEAVAGEADPNVQVLNVQNVGEGTLNWTATNLQPWLTLSPNSGVDDGPCSLYVSIASLAAGLYEDTITVSDPAATNDPQKVPVYLTVLPPPPVIVLDPDSLTFEAVEGGPNPPDQILFISNAVESTLEWTASDDALWLALSPTSGIGDGACTLSVSITAIAAGIYSANVTVSDPDAVNSPQIAKVALYIAEPPPEIALDPDNFFFEVPEGGPNPLGQIMMITNTGGGTLDWTASDDADWLSLDPASGIGDGPCTLFVDVSGLGVGSYDAVVAVSDPAAVNDPQTADVNLIITDTTSGELATVFEPDPAHIYYKFAVDPIMATVYLGNFDENCGAGDVIESSIRINDSIPALSTEILPSHPDFVGEVLAITIPIAPFLDDYGALLDTTLNPYTVSGECVSVASFEVVGEVYLVGKYSQNPKQWIVPENEVVLPGDVDLSGNIDIDDIQTIVNYIFGGLPLPGSIIRADTDCSHSVDIDDIMVLVDYMFGGGPPPCSP
jgi:hypothetical protein